MSEYIEIEADSSDDPAGGQIRTNLNLTEPGQVEEYRSPEAMEEGSPLAQMLAPIEGLTYLRLDGHNLLVRKEPDMPWHILVGEISAAIKEFFL